ncbi:hypothetical protein [Streptomyces violens]|uniref:hypothetical protein n=1 Tax=Streptomyces violens TaxID=66377 RepID=UPI0012FEB00D|nr:hypothetical protein [Streptomyces violens]
MTGSPRPRLKSPSPAPTGPDSAEPAAASSGRGAPKGVGRQAVLSALRPDPHDLLPAEPERVLFGLHIVAPPEWSAICRATATCRCGYERQAKGRAAVLRLVEEWTVHPEQCPVKNPKMRKAA